MKAFIGSYYIQKLSAGSGNKYTAYQIVDYVGRDHLLVEEEGWATANEQYPYQEKSVEINLGSASTHKISIVTLGKFIKDHQDDAIWFYFYENEMKKKLTDLLNNPNHCLKNEDYDDWIRSLTKEICEL